MFQALFTELGLKRRLNQCFRHLTVSAIFGHGVIVMLLMIHLLLGYRRLQDMRYDRDAPMVARLPDVATVSRTREGMDATSVERLRRFSRQQVLDQLQDLQLRQITLDSPLPSLSPALYSGRSPGWQSRNSQIFSSVAKRIPRTRPD
jgi:hypothetical protein